EGLVEDLDFGNAHRPPAVRAGLEDGFFGVLVVFVFDFSDDLFEDVFHGDETRGTAVLVDHHRQVVATASEVAQQDVEPLGFGNENRRPHEWAQIKLRVGDGQQQILCQEDADDV